VVFAGCEDKPGGTGPPPRSPDKERPLTAPEVAAEMDRILAPLYAMVRTAQRESPVPPELDQQLLSQLKELKATHGATPEGERGIRLAAHTLEAQLAPARESQNGPLVLLICRLMREVEPGNIRLQRYEEWARIEKDRPVVAIRGWYEPLDAPVRTVFTFLEVFLPASSEMKRLRVQEGDEFLGLKYRKMIGNKRGMELVYLATGDRFEVYGPRWRR
jgi:hypothetical protein